MPVFVNGRRIFTRPPHRCRRCRALQVTVGGIHIDEYIASVFANLTASDTCADGSCTSCFDILQTYPSSEDGVYTIDPDGANNGYDPFYAYCDMDNGGWTLLARLVWHAVGAV